MERGGAPIFKAMSRMIMLVALLTVLTLRFVDGVAHAHVHDHDTPVETIAVVLDEDSDCGNDDFHAAAHCASHMAETMQRPVATTSFRGVSTASLAPVASSSLHDGRILSPPVRPPLA